MRGYKRHNGGLVAPGAVKRVYEGDTLATGALPSWLTASSGTFANVAPTAGRGYGIMATGSTSGNSAVLTAFSLNTSYFQAILWEVNGLFFDAFPCVANFTINLNGSGSVGGYAHQRYTDTTFQIYSGGASLGSGTVVDCDVINQTSGNGVQDHNIGLMLLPQTKELILLRDQQPVGYRDASSALNQGTIAPALTLATQENVAHSFRFQQIRLTLWSD